jgi:predicted transcriptional regulator
MATKPKPEAAVPELDPAYVAAIEEARAEVDAGKTVPYKAVRRWLLSWGTKKELPRPRCK